MIRGEALESELKIACHIHKEYREGNITLEQRNRRLGHRKRKTEFHLDDGFANGGEDLFKLCESLLDDFDKLWTFTKTPGIEPTNNLAERDLRKLVIWRRKSYGTRSERGKKFIFYNALHKQELAIEQPYLDEQESIKERMQSIIDDSLKAQFCDYSHFHQLWKKCYVLPLVVPMVLISFILLPNFQPLQSQEASTTSEALMLTHENREQLTYSDDFFPISRKAFLNISNLQNLFLRELSSSNDNLEIRIQQNPNTYSYSQIDVRDPKAADLEASQRIFLRMFLHNNHTATLENLAAPSFSGKESIDIINKLKELTHSSIVFFVDGSVQLPCNSNCTQYALTPLRSMSILKTGQSWYEKQGASTNAKILHQFYELHLEQEYLAALEEDRASGIETSWDLNKFKKYYFANIEMSSVSPEAYNIAKNFLHKISIKEIQMAFQGFIQHTKAKEAQEVLENALKLISIRGFNPKTLGEAFNYLEKLNYSKTNADDPIHQLFHDFQDIFVSHRHSLFLSFPLNKGETRDLSPITVATMTQILGEIPILNVSLNNGLHSSQSSIAYNLLLGSIENKKILHDLYEHYLTNRIDDVLEDHLSIAGTKVIANSTEIQRRKWREYNSERGIDNYVDALLPALEWLGSLTLSDFKQINPGFFEHHQHELPINLRNLPEDSTIKQLLIQLQVTTSQEKTQRFLENTIFCLKKPFSDAFLSMIERYQEKPENFRPDEVYRLWILAKLVVDQYSIFGLSITPA